MTGALIPRVYRRIVSRQRNCDRVSVMRPAPVSILVSLLCVSCSGLSSPADETRFVDTLPDETVTSILWSADHEEGDLSDWEDMGTDTYYAGGGVFLTGGADAIAEIVADPVHSGVYAVSASISRAWRAENGPRAVRLMRWTDRPWNFDGDFFPNDCFYSVWMFIPEPYNPNKYPPWDPGDGGWWNVFQFKSDNNAGSQPVLELDLYQNDATGELCFGLSTKAYPDPDSEDHIQTYHEQDQPFIVPVGKWFHIEVRYVKGRNESGAATVWQNGVELFNVAGITTELSEQVAWGIGSYTDHIDGGTEGGAARVYFDDAIVSRTRIGAVLAF